MQYTGQILDGAMHGKVRIAELRELCYGAAREPATSAHAPSKAELLKNRRSA